MRTRFYFFTRDLHLYIGLFLSPFVLLFAASVILLNHPGIPLEKSIESKTDQVRLDLPPGLDRLQGMERVDRARQLLRQAGVSGEIGFVHYSAEEGTITIPVSKPGYEAAVSVKIDTGLASIKQRKTGFWNSIIYLHKMPGPHLANIRGNSPAVRIWAWLADGTAWLLIFLSVSGVYLWAVLRSERKAGVLLFVGGAISLLGALYAICG